MQLVKKLFKRYFIDAMGAMAQGLFASLLIGTIFTALGMIPRLGFLADIGKYAQAMAGPAMAAAIAYSLKAHPARHIFLGGCRLCGKLARKSRGTACRVLHRDIRG